MYSRRYNKLVEPTVDLKPGARILLLKNIDTRNEAKKEQPLVNGTTGRILRWATADEAEAALKAREVYLEDKLEATREQRLAKGKRSHETSLERKLYEELQKLREHCAEHCGHDVDKRGQTIKTAGTLLPWVRFSKGREEVVLPALFDPVWKSKPTRPRGHRRVDDAGKLDFHSGSMTSLWARASPT